MERPKLKENAKSPGGLDIDSAKAAASTFRPFSVGHKIKDADYSERTRNCLFLTANFLQMNKRRSPGQDRSTLCRRPTHNWA